LVRGHKKCYFTIFPNVISEQFAMSETSVM
jgi:hypothetical protein